MKSSSRYNGPNSTTLAKERTPIHKAGVLLLSALLLTPSAARAGFLSIDDSLANETIVISANDFENGLSINGVSFQSGLGIPATMTIPETTTPITFSGSWIDEGASTPGHHIVYLVEADGSISDILDYTVSTDGFNGTITGSFQSDVEGSSLGTLPDPLPADATVQLEADNATIDFSQAFLQAFVISDTQEPNKCPLDQGYWKNNTSLWPITSTTLGGQTYTQAQLVSLLKSPVAGDASLILARQLIVAILNIANGSDPTPIIATINDANALLAQDGTLPQGIKPSSDLGDRKSVV